MLTFTEEILLLLGDEGGVFLPVEKHAFDCALAGAVLMDLAFAYRIDTDLEALFVIDPTPTGNPMLDGTCDPVHGRQQVSLFHGRPRPAPPRHGGRGRARLNPVSPDRA